MFRSSFSVIAIGALVIAWAAPSEPALAQRGFADLHAHPVSHLAFGHRDLHLCKEGLFHGSPGEVFDPSASAADIRERIAHDLGFCFPTRHSMCPIPPQLGAVIQEGQRAALLSNLETATTHGPNGPLSYEHWPHASSVTHQQMHLAWLHNAYKGGLRLMIASITDNEMLSKYYHDDARCMGVFEPDADFNFRSAMKQLDALRQMADDNSHWLEIALDPDHADRIIDDNRLAIIVGLEMDDLELRQIEELVKKGVRSVIPVHLSDNKFGAAAVYDDLFNVLNEWQNDRFFKVVEDETVEFRLGHPSRLSEKPEEALCILQPGNCCSIRPGEIRVEEYEELGYGRDFGANGHRNANGIDLSSLKELMSFKEGLLIDVAHMGWRSTDETLALLAEPFQYPVINSHTGVREGCAHEDHVSERDLTFDHLQRIARLGGMIGLGTVGEPPGAPLVASRGWPAERVTRGARDWRLYRYPFDRAPPSGTKLQGLSVRVRTGPDGLRGGGSCSPSRATLALDSRRGPSELVLNADASGALVGLPAGDLRVIEWDLRPDFGSLLIDDINGFKLMFESGDGVTCSADGWDLQTIHIEYVTDGGTSRGLLVERRGAPWRHLKGHVSEEITLERPYLADPALRGEAVDSLRLKLRIADHPDAGLDGGLVLAVGLHSGQVLRGDLVRDFGFPEGFGQHPGEDGGGEWHLGLGHDPIHYDDIEAIWLESYDERGDSHNDHGDIDLVGIAFSNGSSTFDLVNYSRRQVRGQPSVRLSDRHSTTLFQGLPAELSSGELVFAIGFDVLTGRDNLEGGADVRLVLLLQDGSERDLPLNERIGWAEGDSRRSRKVFVDPPVLARDIIGAELRAPSSFDDDWNVDRFVLKTLSDPADAWVHEFNRVYDQWVDAVGNEPAIALGTDFNGLSPQMPFAEVGPGSDGKKLEHLPPDFVIPRDDTSTGRTIRFERDGLAHYGMLPSFLNAASARESRLVWSVYSSADATVDTWRRSVQAAERVRDGVIVGGPIATGQCRPE